MPQPIIPIHQMNNLDSLFVRNNEPSEDLLSTLGATQQQLLGFTPETKVVEAKVADRLLNNLELVSNSEEEVITAAYTVATHNNGQKYYQVPRQISDGELIALKTEGLVVGSGRLVTITERGKAALRDKWLVAENNLKKNKMKNGFDHPMRHASGNGKFVKTSERVRKVIHPEE
jgi:hypothetical protein